MARRSTFVAFGLFALVASNACNAPGFARKAQAPATLPPTAAAQTTTTGAPVAAGDVKSMGPAVDSAGLSVSNAIAKACGIPARADGKTMAPSFEYDSAALAEEDRGLLAKISKCLTEGALRDRHVKLVGRSDQRGEPEYNMTLGGSRSDTVKRYMVDLGVPRDRMLATSRGEMDAVGTNESDLAHDRRVDVELVD